VTSQPGSVQGSLESSLEVVEGVSDPLLENLTIGTLSTRWGGLLIAERVARCGASCCATS